MKSILCYPSRFLDGIKMEFLSFVSLEQIKAKTEDATHVVQL
jgi:hypothetical protein